MRDDGVGRVEEEQRTLKTSEYDVSKSFHMKVSVCGELSDLSLMRDDGVGRVEEEQRTLKTSEYDVSKSFHMKVSVCGELSDL
ncbi:uncharacterized, partial [Tachysurus ichikawai]